MRKLLLPVLFLIGATAVRAGDESFIGKAMTDATVRECVAAAREPGFEIASGVDTVSVCFVTGEIRRVVFYKQMRCEGTQVCPKVMATLVATVDIGCGGEVSDAQCYVAVAK